MKLVSETALVIVFTLAHFADSDTLYGALGKDERLSEFYKLVNKDEVLQVLLDRREVSIFAPTNEAIRRAAANHTFTDESKLAPFHVLNLLARKNIFPASVPPYLSGVAPLFLSLKETDPGQPKEYFVNNAKIIGKEKEFRGSEIGTQLLYVIDELLEPYVPIITLSPSALELLKKPGIYSLTQPLDGFKSRVIEDREKSIFQRVGNHTFFLPIGSVEDENFKRKLPAIDAWVVRGHVIAKHVLFTRTMSRKAYKSETYKDDLKVELKLSTNITGDIKEDTNVDWYIQSNTILKDENHRKGAVRAKIVKANIPVSNGVVHLISQPLMIIDQPIFEVLEKEKNNNLMQFFNLVNTTPDFRELLSNSQERTVFAPTDKAFQELDSEKLKNILQNTTVAKNLLNLHMVMRSVATEDVWNKNDTTLLASDNRHNLYLRVIGDKRNKTLTVEGGGVNATAVIGDLGATNGILHVIDRVLGMPYLTVYSKLQHDPDLDTTFKLSEQEQWNLRLNDNKKSYTFFVPNKKAWDNLQKEMPSEHKQLHLGEYSYHVRKILERHLVVGEELTRDDLGKKSKIQMVHGMFKISRGIQSGNLVVEWEGLSANIVRPDVQATNGIIHVIDRVMMKRRDLTKSGSARASAVPWILAASMLACSSSLRLLGRQL